MNSRTYTQVARAEASERTRDALLDAATEAFFSGTWGSLSLDAIASAAGTTKQTLLRHYGSKQGLFEASAARAMEGITEQRFSAPADDIAGAVDNLLDHYEQFAERALMLSNPGDMSSDFMQTMGRQGRELHYAWVDHAFGAWLARVDEPERVRRRAAVIALCDVQTWAILARDLGFPRAEVRATLISTIITILEDPS